MMDYRPRPPSKAGRFFKRAALFGFLSVLAICIGGTLFLRSQYGQMGAGLDRERERARRNGLPLSAAEFKRVVADEDNAALDYQKALKALGELDKNQKRQAIDPSSFLVDGEYRPTELSQKALAVVENHVLPFVEAGTAKPDCYFDRDWSDAINVAFPEYAGLKDIQKLLMARVLRRADAGQVQEAAGDLQRMLRLAGHVGNELTVISGLVQNALRSIVFAATESGLKLLDGDAQRLVLLKAVLPGLVRDRDPLEMLRGEPYFGAYLARNLDRWDDISALSPDESESMAQKLDKYLYIPPFQDPERVGRAYEAKLLAFWNDVFEQARMHSWTPEQLGRELDQRAEGMKESSLLTRAFFGVVYPVFGGVGSVEMRSRTQAALIQAARDVLEYRRKHGRAPGQLADASKVFDPFTGKPLRMAVDGKHVLIYSLGADRVDNGGQTLATVRKKNRNSSQFDEAIELPPP